MTFNLLKKSLKNYSSSIDNFRVNWYKRHCQWLRFQRRKLRMDIIHYKTLSEIRRTHLDKITTLKGITSSRQIREAIDLLEILGHKTEGEFQPNMDICTCEEGSGKICTNCRIFLLLTNYIQLVIELHGE